MIYKVTSNSVIILIVVESVLYQFMFVVESYIRKGLIVLRPKFFVLNDPNWKYNKIQPIFPDRGVEVESGVAEK